MKAQLRTRDRFSEQLHIHDLAVVDIMAGRTLDFSVKESKFLSRRGGEVVNIMTVDTDTRASSNRLMDPLNPDRMVVSQVRP